MLFSAALISGSAWADDQGDTPSEAYESSEEAAIDQCVANNPEASRLQCSYVVCMVLKNNRVRCRVPDPLTKEELAELGYIE